LKTGDGGHGAASLRDYLSIVRRQRWIIVQAIVLVPVLALLYSWHQTPVYQGSATVLLSRQNLADQLTNAQNPTANSNTLVPTQAAVARVADIARRTIAQLGLTTVTAEQFLASSSVSQSLNADTLGFNYRSTDASLARRGASAYAQNYVAYRRALDTASFEGARREVDARIKQLVAQGDAKGALYTSLVEREQQLQTLEALQTSNAAVVQTAQSAVKVVPKPMRNGVLGLFLGLVLGLGLAFLRETLDTRVRSAQEIADRLGLPLLGRVPEPPKHLRVEDRLSMLEEPSGLHAEAFRVLRTNIEFSVLDSSVRSVMITSAVEQEGKSTTIANLAVALARGGQSVALVDLDLRRPYIDKFFDVGDRPGITQVALGRATLDEALIHVPIAPIKPSARLRPRYDLAGPANGNGNGNGNGSTGRLFVLGSGPIPPDPGEFVSSHALTSVLLQLNEVAEVILIDAPPLLRVGDAMVLSAKVDALLLATRMEKVRRPMLTDLHRMLETSPARVLGFVVTGAEAEEGYGYGYGYGYGSGYGYGHYLPKAGETEPEPEPSEVG
jgi:succinoglycan biosynthesis transport protein ExoP